MPPITYIGSIFRMDHLKACINRKNDHSEKNLFQTNLVFRQSQKTRTLGRHKYNKRSLLTVSLYLHVDQRMLTNAYYNTVSQRQESPDLLHYCGLDLVSQ